MKGRDLFFAVSGYLITGLLLDSVNSPQYYGAFYAKRILRIIPAFVAFMIAILIVAPAIGLMRPDEHAKLVSHQGWYWTFLVNVLLTKNGWQGATFDTGHLWSLAVEEQFYLLWPLAIAQLRRPATTLKFAGGVIFSVAVLRLIAVRSGASSVPIYVLPIFRADALAWGAVIASIARLPNARFMIAKLWPRLLAVGACSLALVILRLRDANNPSPSMQIIGYSAIGILSAGLIGYAISCPARWLRVRPLRLAGKYSYAFYLWHPPVLMVLARSTTLPWPLYVGTGMVISAALAMASWRLVESPALRLKPLILIPRADSLQYRWAWLGRRYDRNRESSV